MQAVNPLTVLGALVALATVTYGDNDIEIVIINRLGRKIGNSDFSLYLILNQFVFFEDI